jgi:ribosomal protein L37AE/L43A
MAIKIKRTVTGAGKWKCTRCGQSGSNANYDKAQQAGNTHVCPDRPSRKW